MAGIRVQAQKKYLSGEVDHGIYVGLDKVQVVGKNGALIVEKGKADKSPSLLVTQKGKNIRVHII